MTQNRLAPDNLSGPQKAAVLFLVMGEKFTKNYLKELDDQSIKTIGKHMAEINYIPSDVCNTVLDEFVSGFERDVNLSVSGRDFLTSIIDESLDKDTAREVMKLIDNRKDREPFRDLIYIPAENIYTLIRGEHPQTVALILCYLPQQKAAEVLNLFPEDQKAEIALRIVTTDNVDTNVVNELDEALNSNLAKVSISSKKLDGLETLVNILNEVDGKTEESVLSFIEKEDTTLAEAIRQKMFIFEDLLVLDDRHFREVLQNVDNQVLSRALKTSSEEMKQKVFGNLSSRAAEMLKEDMEVMGPVKLSDVEAAQQEILKTTKQLEAEGKIVIAKGKEDAFV